MENIDLVNRITEILGSATSEVLTEYTGWFMLNALIWVVGGAALFLYIFKWDAEPKERWDFIPAKAVRMMLLVITFSISAVNVADVIYPKAAAINQLLHDVR